MWANFEAEFWSRFPRIQKAKKTSMELEREMVELVLKVEDLDKTEAYSGVEVETYKVHAKKLFEMAKQAKIDMGTANIVHVQDKLLEILKDKVGKTHANWRAFCTAIEDVDRTYIRDGVKKLQEQEAKMDSITTQLNQVEHTLARSTTHISDLTTQFSHTTISNAQTAPSNMLQRQSPQQPNYSHQTGPHLSSVATEEEKAMV